MGDVDVESLAGSSSLAAVLPNSRHPDALWDTGLGSLDFLENRLLKERSKETKKNQLTINFNGFSVRVAQCCSRMRRWTFNSDSSVRSLQETVFSQEALDPNIKAKMLNLHF